jgi:hypothetical protein
MIACTAANVRLIPTRWDSLRKFGTFRAVREACLPARPTPWEWP